MDTVRLKAKRRGRGKHYRFCATAVLFMLLFLTACASAVKSSKSIEGVQLDKAIKEAAYNISDRVEAGTKIAIINFNSPTDKFDEYVIAELEANLLEINKLTIIDRKEIDLIRGELKFQRTGEVDDESIQRLGQVLGAQTIVSGSLQDIGGTYKIVIRTLKVETAAVIAQYRKDIANDNRVKALLTGGKTAKTTENGDAALTANNANAANSDNIANGSLPDQRSLSVSASSTTTKYNLGDTGPAGGLIFYDKGNSQGGWRYLEAAPANTEKKAKLIDKYHYHGKDTFDENQTSEELGTGMENAEYLLSRIKFFGYWDTAVQYCDELEINGFADWYLPSIKELSYMYGNLVRKELGGFKAATYWSSSGNDGSGGGQISYGGLIMDMQNGEVSKKAGDNVKEPLNVRACRRF
jgi:hypothetical protein